MSIKSSQELKQLQTRITKLEAEHNAALEELRAVSRKESTLKSQLENLKQQVKALKMAMTDPIVSEHAMLRYIERVLGIDLEDLKARILTEEMKKQIFLFQSGTFPGDGFKAVVKDNVVLTVKT